LSAHAATGFDPATVSPLAGHWIRGRLVPGGDVIEVRRPSDRQVQGAIPAGGQAEADAAVAAARDALPAWSALAPRRRAALMQRWAELVVLNGETIAREESLASSRFIAETRAVDAPVAAEWIRFYAEYADKVDGAVTPTAPDALSLVVHEPYGVVVAIVPWNFPLVLAIWKIAPAIAAGNCVVVKPSELTPYSIVRLAALAADAGIPPGVINVVQGYGHEVGRMLVRHPDTAYVTFTGSTATGIQIMTDAAASGLKPVSLELGGKSPQLVFADHGDLDRVADNVAWGMTRNAGQLCYAGTRLVVDRRVEAPLLDRIFERLRRLEPGATWSTGATLAPVISAGQLGRTQALVDKTLAEGAQAAMGGKGFEGETGGLYFQPTVLRGLRQDMTGFREEIFGPVLGVQTFDDDDEGIALAQHPVYGLAGAVYTRDINKAIRAARSLQAGTVWVNTWGRKAADMTSPFGGYRQSGFGREAGRAGYERFLRTKSIWIDVSEP
jgi:aldehyde dehydrogenase (NAD+)